MVLRLTLILLLLAGCGEGGPGPLVFSVGGTPDELATWEILLEEFQGQTGIDVELLRQPSDSDQQRQALIVALDAERPDPDVLMMDVAWIGLFAAAEWLEPLRDIDRSAFFGQILETADIHDGRLLALPVYIDGGLLYYRTDLLDRYDIDGPPPTLEALLETAQRVQRGERPGNERFYGFVWQGAQYEGLVCSFLEFAGSEGGFVQEGGRLRVDLPANRRALAFMHDLIWQSSVSPPSTYTEMREEEARTWFQSGHALYERNWPYAWSLHQGEGSPVQGKVGVAPMPAPEDGASVSTLGGWHVAVSGFSDRKDDAMRLVRFLTSAATQRRMISALGWNPGRRDLYDDPEVLAAAPHFRDLREVFENARARPVDPLYPQVSAILQRRLSSALAGRVEPGEALDDAQAQIDALFDRYASGDS